jgi:hypothetical protein
MACVMLISRDASERADELRRLGHEVVIVEGTASVLMALDVLPIPPDMVVVFDRRDVDPVRVAIKGAHLRVPVVYHVAGEPLADVVQEVSGS